jgi:hypothetical protein
MLGMLQSIQEISGPCQRERFMAMYWLRRKSALILPPDTGIVQAKEILL